MGCGRWVDDGDFGERRVVDGAWVGEAVKCVANNKSIIKSILAQGGLVEATYVVHPNALPTDIRLKYNTPVQLMESGTLRFAFETGYITESAPIAFQDIDGKRHSVAVSFTITEGLVGFAVGPYNPNYVLTIDPLYTWHTYLGGNGDDQGNAVAVDSDGNVYISGTSSATWGSPVRVFYGNIRDAFVAKLDLSGNLIWNTFLGGSNGEDSGSSIAVDGNGNVYIGGGSGATWGMPVRAYNSNDSFVAKLDTNGNLIWNTFLAGLYPKDMRRKVRVEREKR